jgi:signal peptidase
VLQQAASSLGRVRARSLASAAATSLLCLALVGLAVPAAGIASGRWQLLPVRSGSMQPALSTGSLALAVRAPLASVKRGDVIVYHIPIADHQLTAHRVLRVVRSGSHPIVLTKGDNNARADPWVARLEGSAAWKVKASVPLLGYAALHLSDPRLGVLLLTLATLTGLAAGLRAIWRRQTLTPAPRAAETRDATRPAVPRTPRPARKKGGRRLALWALALTVTGGLAVHALRERGAILGAADHVASKG